MRRRSVSKRESSFHLTTANWEQTREQFLAQAQLLTDALDDESNLGSLPSVSRAGPFDQWSSSACDDASSSSWATTGPSGVRLDGMSILGCPFCDFSFGMSILGCPKGVVMSASAVCARCVEQQQQC